MCNISKDQVHIINNRTLQIKRLVTGVQDAGEYICWVVTPQMEYKNVSSLMVFVQCKFLPFWYLCPFIVFYSFTAQASVLVSS